MSHLPKLGRLGVVTHPPLDDGGQSPVVKSADPISPCRMNTLDQNTQNRLLQDPVPFLQEFSRNAPATEKAARKFIVSYGKNRVDLAKIFAQLICRRLEIQDRMIKEIRWDLKISDTYSVYDPRQKTICINPLLVTNGIILLNAIFHECVHILTNRIDEDGSTNHSQIFYDQFDQAATLFPGITFVASVDEWHTL